MPWVDTSDTVITISARSLHISVAVAIPRLAGVLSSSQFIVVSAGQTITGGLVSSIVTVAVRSVVRPHSSVAVKVTRAVPVAPHRSLSPV